MAQQNDPTALVYARRGAADCGQCRELGEQAARHRGQRAAAAILGRDVVHADHRQL